MEKWALALEGGSLRCMFSAGAVDVMMEHHLWADGVFGVSAGALTGVNYVSRQTGRTAQVNLDFVGDKRYLGLGNLIFKRSIFNFDFLFGEISDKLIPLDRKTFAQSDMEFTAVSTDCRTGQPAERKNVDGGGCAERRVSRRRKQALASSGTLHSLPERTRPGRTPCLL